MTIFELAVLLVAPCVCFIVAFHIGCYVGGKRKEPVDRHTLASIADDNQLTSEENAEKQSKRLESWASMLVKKCQVEALRGYYVFAVIDQLDVMLCSKCAHLLREKYGLTVEQDGTAYLLRWDEDEV